MGKKIEKKKKASEKEVPRIETPNEPLVKDDKVKNDTPSQESQRKLFILGSSLGILVIIIALFGAIYLVTNLGNEPEKTEVIVLEKRSPDEIKFDEMMNDLEGELNAIDANEDFSEFDDSEFAVASDEEELEIAIDDIDQMMSDLEQLEQGLDDFDVEDF